MNVLSDGVLSAVNLAEVLSKLTDRGADVSTLPEDLAAAGVLVEPMTVADAAQVAELRPIDRAGCSASATAAVSSWRAGCRACADRADRAWSELAAGVEVRQVR